MDIKKYIDTLSIKFICGGFAKNKDEIFCKDEICSFNKIYYLKSGNVSLIDDSGITKVKSNSIMVIGANKKHTITTTKINQIEAYWIYFDAVCGAQNLFDIVKCNDVIEVDDDELITRIFEGVLYNIENLPVVSKVLNDKCYILRMVSYFIEKSGYEINTKNIPLKDATDYIEENLDKKLEVGDIASVLNVKNNQCTNLFNEAFGMSPMRFISDARILKARLLLENSDMKIGEIGLECGCGDVHSFSKTFKNNVGLSPSKYRHIFGKTIKVE